MPSATIAAALLRLTSRDRQLVTTLAELRYLTAPQIREACYPSLSIASTSRRLTLLRSRRVLDCLGHRSFDDRRAFWGLGAVGRLAAGALVEDHAPRPAALAVGALLMDHLVATNQIFCDLCAECRAGRLGRFAWLGSHHTHMDLGLTHLVPDAAIMVSVPDGLPWMYCLERDRGTTSPDFLADKCRRYRLMCQVAQERTDDPLWEPRADACLVVACDDDRRAALAARVAAAAGIERAWCGRADECAAALAAAAGAAHAPAAARSDGPVARALPWPGGGAGVSYGVVDDVAPRASVATVAPGRGGAAEASA
ncbi:MAG TPA: replication-relaxation family protein [bacterium]|nr:replication-relaxation family protein [bacterium]